MASIKKRPDGVWRARYRDDTGKEHARHFGRKVDAQAWLDDQTAQIVTGSWADPRRGALTFASWWSQWSARQVWTISTRESADMAASAVTFSDVRMRDLRASHLEAWVKAMTTDDETGKPLAASTISTRFNYVHAALSAAVRDRVIGRDPAEGVRLPKTRRAAAAMVLPSASDVGRALDAVNYFRGFVAVCAFAGLRLGEAAGLQLGDVDFLGRKITINRQIQGDTSTSARVVPPKAGSERTVYVPLELTTLLSRHLEEFGTRGDEGWLLWNPNGDETGRWNRNSAGATWRTVRRRARIAADVTLHDLRHWYASGLIADGCDVVTVQRALGHSSATITLGTYAHLWPSAEDKTRAAAAGLMQSVLTVPADSVRTTATRQGGDQA